MTYANGVVALVSGEQKEYTVNPFTWTWYALSTLVEESENVTEHYSALIEIDSMDTFPLAGQDVWASFDVMLVNESLPADAQSLAAGPVISGSPECWFNEYCPGGYYARYKEASRVTAAFGYNKTQPAGLVSVPYDESERDHRGFSGYSFLHEGVDERLAYSPATIGDQVF